MCKCPITLEIVNITYRGINSLSGVCFFLDLLYLLSFFHKDSTLRQQFALWPCHLGFASTFRNPTVTVSLIQIWDIHPVKAENECMYYIITSMIGRRMCITIKLHPEWAQEKWEILFLISFLPFFSVSKCSKWPLQNFSRLSKYSTCFNPSLNWSSMCAYNLQKKHKQS